MTCILAIALLFLFSVILIWWSRMPKGVICFAVIDIPFFRSRQSTYSKWYFELKKSPTNFWVFLLFIIVFLQLYSFEKKKLFYTFLGEGRTNSFWKNVSLLLANPSTQSKNLIFSVVPFWYRGWGGWAAPRGKSVYGFNYPK